MPRLSDNEVRAIVASYHRLLLPSRAEQEAESLAEDLIEARAREVSLVDAIKAFISELGDDARLLNLDQRSLLKRLYVLAGEARSE